MPIKYKNKIKLALMLKRKNAMEQKISIKIPIMHKTVPYVYIKMSTDDHGYRLSANYKYLNEQYGLKMSFIRNFKEIHNHDTKYFKIIDNKIIIRNLPEVISQSWEMGNHDNSLKITRIIDKKISLIFLERNFYGDINHSIFFASSGIVSSINQI